MKKKNSKDPIKTKEAVQESVPFKMDETLSVDEESTPIGAIENVVQSFEEAAHTNEYDEEFWYARDFQNLLDYEAWRNFEKVILRAITACTESKNSSSDHFVEVNKVIQAGKGAEHTINDYMLSRYACYLIAQNADSRKKPVAFAQTYFAVQTRRQELADEKAIPISEDEKRVFLRDQIKEHNKHLSSAAKGAGVVTPQEYAIFHSHGYQGLYSKTVPQIKSYKGINTKDNILDRMGSAELAANFFRVTQTEEKLKQGNIVDKNKAYQTHYDVGRKVRDAMLKISGVAPEDLPVVEHIKHVERRMQQDVLPRQEQFIEKETPKEARRLESVAPSIENRPINLRKELWKYTLLVMAQEPDREISTSKLIAELPKYIVIPEESQAILGGRKDSKFSQLVRNLKSHKTSKTNFIYQGYAEAINRGFKITSKGIEFVKSEFSDRL